MVRKIIYIVLIVTIGSVNVSFAQDEEVGNHANFIYLNNGEYVYGDDIHINPSNADNEGCFQSSIMPSYHTYFNINDTTYKLYINRDNYIQINDKKYNFSRARFIMMDSVYLAIVDDIARKKNVHLANKIIDGNINVFGATVIEKGQVKLKFKHYFYNREKQKPKRLRYKNIKHEFRKNSKSMKYLKKHRRMQYVEAGIDLYTLTYIGITTVRFFKFVYPEPNFFEDKVDLIVNPTGINFPDVAINVAIGTIPAIIFEHLLKDKMYEYLLDSVKAYNWNNREK
ncbi:MAG: hypothetical protein K9I29_04900 [Bacteroidales bacterium]|nr:hypothetical protein [Bacteroidales bacterium]MCF8327612.1 hypothetical protein [Bacteroidales bacterium]